MKTAIIGNGIIALTTAFKLLSRLSPSDEITILGKANRQGAATTVAPAMLNSFGELETDTLNSEVGRYRFELSREATKLWPSFIKEILDQAEPWAKEICGIYNGPEQGKWFDTGTYIVNNSAADALDDENFDAIVNGLKAYKEPFEMIAPRDIPNYLPEQHYRATRALYIPSEGWINPRLLIEILENILKNHPQVTLIDEDIDRLTESNKQIDHIITASGKIISGDKFLLAAGAFTTDLVAKSQLSIAMQRVFYGAGVTLEIYSPDYPHQKCVRTPNRGLACGLYSAPYYKGPKMKSDYVAAGASNFVSPTPCFQARLTSVSALMKGLIEQINANFYRAELVNVNVGQRPLSQDSNPLLGQTSIKNLVIATGTRREGIHLAPIISDRLAAILSDESVETKFNMLNPERPLIQNLSREEGIKKATKHLISAAYQHGFSPSQSRMPQQIKKMYQDDLERLHDKVGAFGWGIPADMLDMYRYGHASLTYQEKLTS